MNNPVFRIIISSFLNWADPVNYTVQKSYSGNGKHIPAEAKATFVCRSHSFNQKTRNVIISEVKWMIWSVMIKRIKEVGIEKWGMKWNEVKCNEDLCGMCDLWWTYSYVLFMWFVVSRCLIAICFTFFIPVMFYLIVLCFLIILFSFLILYVLLYILCVLWFYVVLYIVSYHVWSCLFSNRVQIYLPRTPGETQL